jgi:hypothetical protein
MISYFYQNSLNDQNKMYDSASSGVLFMWSVDCIRKKKSNFLAPGKL